MSKSTARMPHKMAAEHHTQHTPPQAEKPQPIPVFSPEFKQRLDGVRVHLLPERRLLVAILLSFAAGFFMHVLIASFTTEPPGAAPEPARATAPAKRAAVQPAQPAAPPQANWQPIPPISNPAYGGIPVTNYGTFDDAPAEKPAPQAPYDAGHYEGGSRWGSYTQPQATAPQPPFARPW